MLALTLAQNRRMERPVVAGAVAVIIWSVLLAVTSWSSAAAVVAPVMVVLSIVINVGVRPSQLGRLAAAVVALAALVLLARADIHGSALAAGLTLGILLACRQHGRSRSIEPSTN